MQKITKKQVLFAILGLIFLSGCQATTGYYKGALAPADTVATLPKKAQVSENWQDLYTVIDYSWQKAGETWTIDGVFSFAHHPQIMMTQVRDFDFKLFFLDKNQRVLDYFDLVWVPGPQLNGEVKFSHTLTFPEGTEAISFGYEGRFVDEEGYVDWVWKMPLTSAE